MKLRAAFLFLFLMILGGGAFAQSQNAIVKNNGALVYKEADFDAPVMAELKAGTIYQISLKTRGPFYKIRLKPGVLGWIADTDVALQAGAKAAKQAPVKKGSAAKNVPKTDSKADKKSEPKIDTPSKPQRPFYASRYRGPTLSYLTYNENTMGENRSQNLPFYGFKVAGPNTMFAGDLRTDAEFLFHFGAPNYYEKYTGQSAAGWIFLADFIFETALPQSKWHMLTFGFGPMFKYSHLETGLTENNKVVNYSLDDMALGVVLDGGLAFRLGSYALRFNAKYYWEKTKYWGFGATFGFPF